MTKINQLINNWPKGTIKTVKELLGYGYTPQLLKSYSNSGWLELFARGMYKLTKDEVEWQGVLFGLQKKSDTTLHAGGKTALNLKGYSHYISPNENKVYLYSGMEGSSYVWVSKLKNVVLKKNKVFAYNNDEIFVLYNNGNFYIRISSPELAILELLYLIPYEQTFDEAFKIMEGLTTLRPKILQTLLERTNSVKVKRLFLYMSDKQDQAWMKELNLTTVNLGSGKRSIVKNGALDKKYNITVPKEYVE